jgi:tetratricopeptide (TPR) repeat protein
MCGFIITVGRLTRYLMIFALDPAMNNLSLCYSELGRYQDALMMQEKTLEFQRRVLPENHPEIGAVQSRSIFSYLTQYAVANVMNNLAATYFDLGRYKDALVMQERTLECRRRALPENHPDIGTPLLRFFDQVFDAICCRNFNEQSSQYIC